jgi:hypothetical protein
MSQLTNDRWGPWWAYAVPLFVLNVLRQAILPPGEVGDAASIGLFAATAAVVFLVVTAAYRMTR